MVAVASQFMQREMAQLGPLGKDCAKPSGGSSHVGAWFNRNCPPVISIVNNGHGHGCDSIWGDCNGHCGGGWNGGLHTFSEIIEDRDEVSFWDSLMAGMKEQAYKNPMGMISSALSAGGSLLGVVPSLLGGIGGLLGGVGGLFSGGLGSLFGGGGSSSSISGFTGLNNITTGNIC